MPFTYDPEIEKILIAAAATADSEPPVIERGDALGLRAVTDPMMQAVYGQIQAPQDIETRDFAIPSDDGHEITVRWYKPAAEPCGSAVVYAHGGGMICGSVDVYDQLIKHYVGASGVPFLSVDYRLAPENTADRLAKDVYAAIAWLQGQTGDFEVDPTRIAVMGDSGGGGVAAGAAILARDNGIALARQILIYPMLDDRNLVPDPELAPMANWTYDNNFTGWNALLTTDLGDRTVSPIASPARLTDFSNLAPAFIDVGELDIFRDESVNYSLGLYRAGVSCELHVRAGAPHCFEWIAPTAAVSERSMQDRLRVLNNL